MSDIQDFVDALRPASFRGVPFATLASRKVFGRRTAVHEYPFRDTIWVEDLGRKGREISLSGFLVANSLVYGGGDVLAQQDQLIAAAETKGPGKLVHPTLGELTVSCLSVSIDESFDSLGVFAIEFTFLEAGEKVFPALASATTTAATAAKAALDAAAASDAADAGAPLLVGGPPQTNLAAAAAGTWSGLIAAAALDATGVFNLASQLSGPYGRFFNGGNLGGFVTQLASIYAPDTTVGMLIGAAANARGAVLAAVRTVAGVAGGLGLWASSYGFGDLATAAQAAVAALLAATADPADAIRLLTGLATAAPATVACAAPIGAVVGSVFRRAAIAALGRSAAAYQPASNNDAAAVMLAVTAVFDGEITRAGDAGDDASFNALRGQRLALIQDLTTRGANLSATTLIAVAEATPSVVLAQRLYRDAGRAGELEIEAAPVHPLFISQPFQALAA
jgi:prophage DNA circulation protein